MLRPLAAAAIATMLVSCATRSATPASPASPSPAAATPASAPRELPAPPDVAAPPAAATKTPSGLATLVLQPGTGTLHPTAHDTVNAHYTGWTTDGKMFDSSLVRGVPARLPLAYLIPGFAEGLELMVVGEKRRLWIPEALAYQGKPGRPAGMLVFDIELLEILPAAPQ